MSRFLIPVLLITSTIFTSCNKESQTSSESAVVLTSDQENNFIDLETNFTPFPNQSILFVDNFDPYGNMLSQVYAYNQPEDIRNLVISEVKIDRMSVTSFANFTMFEDYLTACELIVQNHDGTNKKSLATLSGLNSTDKVLTFTFDTSDLTDYFKSTPDEMFFKFSFSDLINDPILVNYEVVLNFKYSFSTPKKKK